VCGDDATLWVDVAEFREALAADDLTLAVKLYRGNFLEGHYGDWLLMPRLELRNQALEAMARLAAACEADGRLDVALRLARRLALSEPLREEGHRLVIRLLARLQRRSEALAHYDYLVSLLDDEVGAEPMPETSALVSDIRNEPVPAKPVLLQQGPYPLCRPGGGAGGSPGSAGIGRLGVAVARSLPSKVPRGSGRVACCASWPAGHSGVARP